MAREKEIITLLTTLHDKVDKILGRASSTLAARVRHLEKDEMALTAEVQKLVDDVAANKDLAQSAIDGLGIEATQIAALQQQIADLIAAGGTINAEDLAALQSSATLLEETNTKLQTAVPAHT